MTAVQSLELLEVFSECLGVFDGPSIRASGKCLDPQIYSNSFTASWYRVGYFLFHLDTHEPPACLLRDSSRQDVDTRCGDVLLLFPLLFQSQFSKSWQLDRFVGHM